MKYLAGVALLIATIAIAPFPGLADDRVEKKPILIHLSKTNTGEDIVRIDGRRVTWDQVVDVVGTLTTDHDAYHPVKVIAHVDVELRKVRLIREVLAKIGFFNVHYFTYEDNTGRMGEFVWGVVELLPKEIDSASTPKPD